MQPWRSNPGLRVCLLGKHFAHWAVLPALRPSLLSWFVFSVYSRVYLPRICFTVSLVLFEHRTPWWNSLLTVWRCLYFTVLWRGLISFWVRALCNVTSLFYREVSLLSWILKLYDNTLDENFLLLNLLQRVLSGLSFWSLSLFVFRCLELFWLDVQMLSVINPFVRPLICDFFFYGPQLKRWWFKPKHLKFSTDIRYCVCA